MTKVGRNTVESGGPDTVTGNGADSLLPLPGGPIHCVPGQRQPAEVLLPLPETSLCYRYQHKTTPSLAMTSLTGQKPLPFWITSNPESF